MRTLEWRIARAERDGDRVSRRDRDRDRDGSVGFADSDAVTHAESDRSRGVADAHRDERFAEPEPFAGRRDEPAADRGRQRDERPALRDADRDRLPRAALALPVAWRRTPPTLAPSNCDDPGGEQGNRFDKVVEEVQIRARNWKTAEDETA